MLSVRCVEILSVVVQSKELICECWIPGLEGIALVCL